MDTEASPAAALTKLAGVVQRFRRKPSASTRLQASGEAPVHRVRTYAPKRVAKSLDEALAVLEAREAAGYQAFELQVVIQVTPGGRWYEAFRGHWAQIAPTIDAPGSLDADDCWPQAIPEVGRFGFVIPTTTAQARIPKVGSATYKFAFIPMWADVPNPAVPLDVWCASCVDAWIRWVFTLAPGMTARLATPVIEVRPGAKRITERRALDFPAAWPVWGVADNDIRPST